MAADIGDPKRCRSPRPPGMGANGVLHVLAVCTGVDANDESVVRVGARSPVAKTARMQRCLDRTATAPNSAAATTAAAAAAADALLERRLK